MVDQIVLVKHIGQELYKDESVIFSQKGPYDYHLIINDYVHAETLSIFKLIHSDDHEPVRLQKEVLLFVKQRIE